MIEQELKRIYNKYGMQKLLRAMIEDLEANEVDDQEEYAQKMVSGLKSVEDAYYNRYSSGKTDKVCDECHGMGWLSAGAPLRECPRCEGIGYLQ